MKKLIAILGTVAVVISISLVYFVNMALVETQESEELASGTIYTSEQTDLETTSEETSEEIYSSKIITLEKQAGDTSIENSSGKILDLRDSSKMYNGYKAYTSEGYIWIALDDNGVLKMDMDTEIKIEKNGNDLEVLLISGEVFFNISESFEEDETFTIRTSTMTTGIRGTSGIVSTETLADTNTEFSMKLLEGSVELTYLVDNATETHLASELVAGQQFTLSATDETEEDILISALTDLEVSDVNGFVAIEIKESQALQEKIASSDSLIDEDMLSEIIENAEGKLAEDEALKQELNENYSALQLEAQEQLEALAVPITFEVDAESAEEEMNSANSESTSGSSSAEGSITVSFYYYKTNATTVSVFATQVIEESSVPEKPFLQPSVNGGWYYISGSTYKLYDFTTELTSNTSLIWMAK